MSGVISHFLCAENVFKEIEDKNLVRKAFLWGAQGPDIFFFHRFFPWDKGTRLIQYGTRMHDEKPSLLFDVIANYLKKIDSSDRVSLSYGLGFLCHYAFDRAAHPFVNFATQELESSGNFPKTFNVHSHIESCLDIILLRSEMGIAPVEFDMRSAAPASKNIHAAITAFHKYVLRHRFGVQADEKNLDLLYSDMRKMLGLLNNRSMVKKPAIEFVEKIIGRKGTFSVQLRGITEGDDYDYANINHLEWYNPKRTDIIYDSDFFEIFHSACADSVTLINKYIDYLSEDDCTDKLESIIGNLSFRHGLKIV